MPAGKVIGRIVCASSTHVLAKLIDTPAGAALRSHERVRVPEHLAVLTHDDVPVAFLLGQPDAGAVALRCACGSFAVGVAVLVNLDAEYRRTGRPGVHVASIGVPHP